MSSRLDGIKVSCARLWNKLKSSKYPSLNHLKTIFGDPLATHDNVMLLSSKAANPVPESTLMVALNKYSSVIIVNKDYVSEMFGHMT